MYDPSVGRWLEEDPVGFDAGDANLYRYAGNDPTDAIDPEGLQTDYPMNAPDVISPRLCLAKVMGASGSAG